MAYAHGAPLKSSDVVKDLRFKDKDMSKEKDKDKDWTTILPKSDWLILVLWPTQFKNF